MANIGDRLSSIRDELTQKARQKSAQTATAPQTARQRMMLDEEDEDKWYRGTMPTSSETLARIYTIGKSDPQQGQKLFDAFTSFQSDPSTPYYNPYSRATNRAIDEIAALGVDTSGGIGSDWLQKNASLMNSYRLGTGTSPLAPSSKSTREQNAAYWYYKIADAEETTQKAETEWAALQEEIAYWVGRIDRNYSDDEILSRIDWSQYKTLTAMDEARQKGTPMTLNRAIGYSQDALYGTIWAARNEGGTGNPMIDGVKAALGEGKAWQENTDISDRLDPTSDRYNPYSVGATLDDAALYFGVSSFDQTWLDGNRAYLAGNDKTAKKYYGKVYDAEQTTQKAEAELTSLWSDIDSWLTYISDPDVILDGLLDNYPTLKKMDESRKSGDLLATTRAIDYRWEDVEAEVRKRCAAQAEAKKADAYVADVTGALGAQPTGTQVGSAISEAKDSTIGAAGKTIGEIGTKEEQSVWKSAYSADFDTYIVQISEALQNGVTDPQGGYDYCLERANEYAGAQYIQARESGDEQTLASILRGYEIADRMAALTGAKPGDTKSAMSALDYAYQYGRDYVPTNWTAQNLYDAALEQGSSLSEVRAAAKQGAQETQAEIARIDEALAYIDSHNIVLDRTILTNMQRERDRLNRDLLDAQYFELSGSEDFEQVSQETADQVRKAWSGFSLLPTMLGRDGYSELDYAMTDTAAAIRSDTLVPYMTDAERSTYLYLLGTQGQDAAKAYYDHLANEENGVLQTRQTQRGTAFWQEFTQEHPLAGNALAVIASPMQAAGGLYSVKAKLSGQEINPNASAFAPTHMNAAIRGTSKEMITQELGEGTAANFLANLGYDAVTSSADSLVSAYLGGGSTLASVTMMASQAASSAIEDAKQRGATDGQALMLGGVNFLAETVTEYLPMDQLLKIGEMPPETVREFLTTALKQMTSEGTEELVSGVIETASDELIMKNLSAMNTSIAAHMADGMSEEDARKAAFREAVTDILYGGLAGAVSGGISATAQTAMNLPGRRRQQNTQETSPEGQNGPSEPAQTGTEEVPAEAPTGGEEARQSGTEGTGAQPGTEEAPAGNEETQQPGTESAEAPPSLTEEEAALLTRQQAALAQALTTEDTASRTATLAGVLAAEVGDFEATSAASAAAQHMMTQYGSQTAIEMTREILLTAAELRMSGETLRAALHTAALGEGASAAVLSQIMTEGPSFELLGALVDAASEDVSSPTVQETMRKAVTDNQIATRVKALIADGALSGLRSYEEGVSKASSELRTAQKGFSTAVDDYRVAGENLESLQAQWSQNPSDAALQGAMQQAVKDVGGKAIVVEQYRQSVEKAQEQVKKAQDALASVREETMKRIREQAQQEVMQAKEQAQTAREAAARQAYRDNAVSGTSGTVYTGDNTPLSFHYAVVDIGGLIASNDTNMNVNPEYPQELQPRDRTRSSSVNQVSDMARTLNPARLGESADVQSGSPIVGSDFVVESGNGRVLAIAQAMRQGLDTAKDYTIWLRDNASRFGLDPAAITDSSVLVRVRDTDVDRAAFVKAANESATSAYSQTENARSDAEKLTSETLSLFVPSDNGEINSRENGDFLTAFMQQVIPQNEQAAYRQADGTISQAGLARIRNALFQKAYGSTQLTSALAESTDESVKNVLRALTNAAPRVALVSQAIADGRLHNLDIGPELAQAAESYRRVRQSGGTVEDYLSQYRMPGFETESETAQALMRMMDRYKRSGKNMTQAITDILDKVESYGDPNQTSMFEQTVPSLADLVNASLERTEAARKGQAEGQTSIFAELSPVFQAITSARTSIKQVPALFKNQYAKFGKVNIDIGGGRFDLATQYLASIGTENKVFDPYNRGEAENRATLAWLQDGNKADTATCANVLNVIAEPAARANVILETAKSISQNGKAYFMVYEGDGSGEGRETGSGWQNNRKTADYVSEIEQYFDDVTRKGKMIIAQNPKIDLPAASWEVQPGQAILYDRSAGVQADTPSPGAPQPGQSSGPVKSGDTIMKELADALELAADTRTKKYLRQLRRNTNGYTRIGSGVIHVRDASNVETAAHEYGHVFDQIFGLRAQAPVEQMVNNLLADPRRSAWIQQYPAAQRPGEAIAEFARYWIIDRQSAVAFGGQQFTELWERSLQERGWLAPMQQAAQDLRLNRAATAGERAKAAIDLTDMRKETKYKKGLRGLATALADYTLPLVELTNARKAVEGEGFQADKDVRTLLLAKESMISNLTDRCLYDNLVDPQGNVVHRANGDAYGSLRDILQKVPREKEKDFGALWACLHAQSRQDVTIDKAVFGREVNVSEAIANLTAANPELRGIIDECESWYTAFMQTWLVDTGMMAQDDFDLLRVRYPYYVPTFRSGMGENRQTRVRANDTPGNAVQTARGGTSNLYNPVMGMVEYMQRYIANYKHVEVLRAFDDTMRTVPDLYGIAEPVQADVTPENRRAANAQARQAVEDAIEAIRNGGDTLSAEAEAALLGAMDALPEQGWVYHDTVSGNDVLNVPRADGTIGRWTVYNTDMLEAMLAQPPRQTAKALRAIGQCTRFLCSMATGRSFSFALQNYASDTETAMNTGHGAGNWLTFIPQQIGTMFSYLNDTIRDRRGLETSEAYRQFQVFGQMGSRFAFRDTRTQEETRSRLYGGRPGAKEIAKTIASSPVIALEAISGFLEDSTRYNEFRHSGENLDTYSGRLLAGKDAREVTTDFSKRGSAEEIKYAKLLIPFFGAQVQGVYKTARLFSSENAGHRAQIAGRILINGVMANLILAAIRNLTWKDEEKEAYGQLSAYETNKYYHFKIGDGKFVRIKRSQDAIIQTADAVGTLLGNTMTGYEGDAWGDLVAASKEIAGNMVTSFDTVFDPFFDAANNQTWYGGAIEDYNMQSLPTTARYEAETPKIYRYLSGVLNTAGIQYSPLDVEYIVSQYTGSLGVIGSGILGLGTEGKLTADGVLGVVRDRLADRFSVDPVYTNAITSAFYEGKTQFEEMISEIKLGRPATYLRSGLTQEEANAAAAEAKALMSKGGALYEINNQAKDLWAEHDAILESDTMTDAQKEQAAREARRQINALLLEGNTVMGDFWAKYGYGNETQQRMSNFLNLFTGSKEVPKLPTAYDLMPQTFADDIDLPYMQQAKAVYEATGKSSALPHPNQSFTVNGTTYSVDEADWDNFTLQYKMAYQKYLVGNSKGWDHLTDEERLGILGKAHTAGSNAAKKWYTKLKKIK